MDAQNAAEPVPPKPSSPKRLGIEPERPTSSTLPARPPSNPRTSPPAEDATVASATAKPNDDDGDGAVDGNSDAETIVLPGKDGHSPTKVRKIKNEDKGDGDDRADWPSARRLSDSRQEHESDRGFRSDKAEDSAAPPPANEGDRALALKKKSLDNSLSKDTSSGLSSAPASPPPRQRRSSYAHSDSDLEQSRLRSPKLSREKPRIDRLIPHKRKATRTESEDEGEPRKVRRQRNSGSGLDASRGHRDSKPSTKAHPDAHSGTRIKSTSPPARTHRRSTSTQLPSQSSNGLSQKKKRIPAPLQSTDYHSDESTASGSPHPRSSKLRSLTTPATTESTVSPVKVAPHKKHLDAHGQTFLARACARGEYDIAKQRLQERPEDINVADYAGNTPLQIAAINGCEDIVKLLIDAGCSLDCVNYDKDTPLLDAVDNGHLGVVKLLLAAGVNPRKANAYGQEPLDRVSDDTENAEEIRKALQEAKERMGEQRRTSEDHHPQDHLDARSSHGPESPRRSPSLTTPAPSGSTSRRSGTVRSTKTSNHLLYMPMDDKTLRAAAARGDEETVTRILQVRETFDDPESMVAAARGGHDIVMQLLLALGRANPDPGPISSSEYSTPMLAAIGQENIKVVRLLLDQTDFDPTRRFKGETYFEIARRRKGPNWIEEEQMLKDAYDEYKRTHKESGKAKSPNRREQEREARRNRPEARDEVARSSKRKMSSPTTESNKKSSAGKVTSSPKEKKRTLPTSRESDEQISPKRSSGKAKKDDGIPAIPGSDREPTPGQAKQSTKTKRTESDIAVSSEGETVKPRRKLVSGRELKGEREKKRRSSMTSNASSMKESNSPSESRHDEPYVGKQQKSERYHDRAKALKRDESRDRISASGEGSTKRHRASATPPRFGSDKDGADAIVKRRRLETNEPKDKRQKTMPSSEERPHKLSAGHDAAPVSPSASKAGQEERDDGDRGASSHAKQSHPTPDLARRGSGKSSSSDKSIHVKSEDTDVEMHDVVPHAPSETAQTLKEKHREEAEKELAEARSQAQEAKRKEEDARQRKRKEDDDREKENLRRQAEQEEAKRRAEEERLRREEEERKRKEAEEQRQKEEQERARREEEERARREEEERKRREEEERKRLEEESRRKREEEERRQREAEERRKREEEERLRREQLEREAAEEARRKKEEEERKEQERKEQERREQERKERALREEMERRRAAREAERAAREAEQRRIRLEMEKIRLAKLPPLLRWLDGLANPKVPEVASRFSMMQGVRYDCIRPEATGTPDGREQWLLNTQVALLLGEKDLELSRYTAWERIPVSNIAKRTIWRLESDRYALTTPSLFDLGRQLPNYYGEDPERMSYRAIERLRGEAWDKFLAMDMFFVKASELMFIIPTVPHLRSVRLTMAYRELPEHESQFGKWTPLQKWKNDPDANRFYGFAPRNKYYINGELVHEEKPGLCAVSTSPFPESRVPRKGLLAVSPDDPDYARLCREQGLDHLVANSKSSPLPNGLSSSPKIATSNSVVQGPHGAVVAVETTGTNGHLLSHHPMSPASESEVNQSRPLVNGVHWVVQSGAE
ncbi:hypothetical protein VTK73DRAFT_2998 [Phialemonium thermophilum]|uniref:Uncharacterized protein n=1 Tax=Phialemonium thermophilum TaxID=223376 RepID=A0ABR3Y150_9PEZI